MGRSLHLLLVEDHEDSAELLAELLESRGHSVVIATSAARARTLASEYQFDVIVSDVGLPDATGYELMAELHTRYAMKGIAVTGASRASDVEQGLASGFSVHLIKPVSLSALTDALEQVAG